MVAPGDKVIVCRNGVFGGRMSENVERGVAQAAAHHSYSLQHAREAQQARATAAAA